MTDENTQQTGQTGGQADAGNPPVDPVVKGGAAQTGGAGGAGGANPPVQGGAQTGGTNPPVDKALQDQDRSKFDIPVIVQNKYADIVDLIFATKSMDDKERQYWFHILPVMNEQQVSKLRGILENEKQKLAEIEQKYSGSKADKPPVREMKEGEISEKIQKVQAAEQVDQKSEASKEAELLSQLENL